MQTKPEPNAEDKAPEAKPAEEPAPAPKREFYGLKCTDERPPNFHGGRFVRSAYPAVIGRPLMRK
jgi:hypothetical protein